MQPVSYVLNDGEYSYQNKKLVFQILTVTRCLLYLHLAMSHIENAAEFILQAECDLCTSKLHISYVDCFIEIHDISFTEFNSDTN
jgi:hypothetical protein